MFLSRIYETFRSEGIYFQNIQIFVDTECLQYLCAQYSNDLLETTGATKEEMWIINGALVNVVSLMRGNEGVSFEQ